jgi:hypothetical protein
MRISDRTDRLVINPDTHWRWQLARTASTANKRRPEIDDDFHLPECFMLTAAAGLHALTCPAVINMGRAKGACGAPGTEGFRCYESVQR